MKNAEKTAPGAFLKAVRVSGKGAFLKAVRVSGKGTKDSKGKKDSKGTKEGKKESGSKKKKRPAAEGKETDAGADVRTVRTQKSPEAFPLQDSC